MMRTFFLLFLSLVTFSTNAQTPLLNAFEPLIGHTWSAQGKWGDGSVFEQETTFTAELEGTIVVAKSKGFVDQDQTQYGDRNHGIRKYDEANKQIIFYEFDTFGGLTEGIVLVDGKNLYYQYKYGDAFITDGWEYQDENTYKYTVGVYEAGEWKATYLSTVFKKIR